jgi:hypothetical protein
MKTSCKMDFFPYIVDLHSLNWSSFEYRLWPVVGYIYRPSITEIAQEEKNKPQVWDSSLAVVRLRHFGCERGTMVTTCKFSKSEHSRIIADVMSHDMICRCGFARDISRVHLAAPLELAPGKPLTDVTLPLSSLTCHSLCRNSNSATLPTTTIVS